MVGLLLDFLTSLFWSVIWSKVDPLFALENLYECTNGWWKSSFCVEKFFIN